MLSWALTCVCPSNKWFDIALIVAPTALKYLLLFVSGKIKEITWGEVLSDLAGILISVVIDLILGGAQKSKLKKVSKKYKKK